MTEAMEATAPADQVDTAEATPAAERPEWLDAKFFDAETGTPRYEELGKAHKSAVGLIGKRIQDLSDDNKRELAQYFPDEFKAHLEASTREKVMSDPELREKLWEELRGEKLPAPPEEYDLKAAIPEGWGEDAIDPEDPVLGKFSEFAKANGFSQDQFAALYQMGLELQGKPVSPEEFADQQINTIAEALGTDVKSVGARFEAVRTAAQNAVVAGLPEGPERDKAIADNKHFFDQLADGQSFLAVQRLLKLSAGSQQTPGMGDGASQPAAKTEAEITAMMQDPKYHLIKDPAYIAEVKSHINRLYGGTL